MAAAKEGDIDRAIWASVSVSSGGGEGLPMDESPDEFVLAPALSSR